MTTPQTTPELPKLPEPAGAMDVDEGPYIGVGSDLPHMQGARLSGVADAYSADQMREYAQAALAATQERAAPLEGVSVKPNSQDWAGMDGQTAFHLIERHADGWADIQFMMGEWLTANQAAQMAQIAAILKYPEEWDTAVYPTLVQACDAMNHAAFCHADNQGADNLGFECPPIAPESPQPLAPPPGYALVPLDHVFTVDTPPGRGMVPMTLTDALNFFTEAERMSMWKEFNFSDAQIATLTKIVLTKERGHSIKEGS